MENECYLAWATDDEMRGRGSSGGFVTAALVAAMRSDLIDETLVVKKRDVDIYDGYPFVTRDPEEIIECSGSLHFVPLNLAKFVPHDKRVGVVAKPCDCRGIIEQAKRGQIDLEKVYMIGLNCGGAIHPTEGREMLRAYGIDPDRVVSEEISRGNLILRMAEKGEAIELDELEEIGYGRRDACKACNINIPTMADLAVGNWGVPKGEEATFVEILTEKGEEIFENAVDTGYVEYKRASEKALERRRKVDEAMKKMAENWRAHFDKLVTETEAKDRLHFYIDIFKNCIHCGACKEVCPACACGDDAKCIQLNDEKDVYKISMYNLTRILHLMDSCVGCGECEDVCPVDIPLTLIHKRFTDRMRQKLGYIPGVDLRKPPLYEVPKSDT